MKKIYLIILLSCVSFIIQAQCLGSSTTGTFNGCFVNISNTSNLGNVASGTWNGTVISFLKGGADSSKYSTHYYTLTNYYNKTQADVRFLQSINSGMVVGALGYTPYSNTNPNNYLSSINSSDVTSALGYTPYNVSNPSGYLTSINSLNVTAALGFTPINPNGSSGQYFAGDGSKITFPIIPTNTNQLTNGAGFLTSNQTITLSGDISGSGITSIVTTLGNSGVSAGSYTGTYTVDSKGRITSASNKAQSIVSRTLGSSFQISASKAADVNYSVLISLSSVLTGTASGIVQFQISPDNITFTTASTSGYSISGLVSSASNTQVIGGFVPTGYYVKVVFAGSTTGIGSTSSGTYQTGQEITY